MKKKTSEIKPIKKTTFAEKPTIIIPHETERKKNYSKTIKIKRSNTLKIKFNMAIRDTNITDETFTLSTLEKNNTNQNNNTESYLLTQNSTNLSLNRKIKKNHTTKNSKYQFPNFNRKLSVNCEIIPKIFNLNNENTKVNQRKSIFAPLVEKKYWDHNRRIYDPLEVPPEDEIFNHHLLKPKTEKIKKEKENSNSKDKRNNNSKQKTPYQTISEKILGKIYNNNPVIDKKVFYLKKKKGKFSLGNYQKLLLRTCEPGLSKDSIKKLNGAFNKLRNSCRQKFDTDYRFIKDIEDEEEKIINRINVSGNVYVKLMSKSIDFNKTHSSFRNNELNLPKIRFRKVMNKKKYQKYLN